MDDFNLSCLTEAKNEYAARLVNILTPCVHDGIKSIFQEAWNLCDENDEQSKYLVTFQNFLARIPKWNQAIIEEETARIVESSGCHYLEDLVTCVHIIQLKVLTSIRVGMKQKKLELDVPQLGDFIHRVYIAVARKLYKNVYLLERGISALQVQRYQRELELIIRESILNTIRDSIPTDHILRAYMDPSTEIEEEVEEREYVENIAEGKKEPNQQDTLGKENKENTTENNTDDNDVSGNTKQGILVQKQDSSKNSLSSDSTLFDVSNTNTSVDMSNILTPILDVSLNVDTNTEKTEKTEKTDKTEKPTTFTVKTPDSSSNPSSTFIQTEKQEKQEPKKQTLQFNDIDQVLDMGTNKQEKVDAPKTVERLERIGEEKDQQRRMEDEEEPLQILDDVNDTLDIESLDKDTPTEPPIELGIEELPF